MEFRVLGPLEALDDGRPVTLGGVKPRSILAVLLLHANTVVSTDRLIEEVWGEEAEVSRQTVHGYVSNLRQWLTSEAGPGTDLLVSQKPGYVARVREDQLDLLRFEAGCSDGGRLLAAGDHAAAARRLRDALALWRGPALADLADQPFALTETARLESLRINALEDRLDADLALGRHTEVVSELEDLVVAHPLRERLWGQLMLALYRCGRQSDAFRAGARLRRILNEELGIDPSPELATLEGAILDHEPDLAWTAASGASGPAAVGAVVGASLPTGVVTFLLTDVAGSTRLWQEAPAAMADALSDHDRLLAETIGEHGGTLLEAKGEGDRTFSVFARATDGLAAAVAAQRALSVHPWPSELLLSVRMALHTGEALERERDYHGPTVNRAVRLRALAAGGQVLLSQSTTEVVADHLPEGVSLRSLGRHRLKDLATPEDVSQVDAAGLAHEFPPLPSLDNPALPNNLPVLSSSFVGRDRELSDVRTLLNSHRLVTLAGAGGAGKTRLALHVAADLLDGSGDGVWFVELAPVERAAHVAAAVARVLGVRERASSPILDGLVEALRDRQVLVVLDNCEQVVDAVAKLADALLRSCPDVELLATSREPLGIDGECVYRVPSLPIPDTTATFEEIVASDAVNLFAERARAHPHSFAIDTENAATVAEVVRRLDGMPLALELAAARLRSMSIAEVAGRLDDRFRLLTTGGRTAQPRQQTLRGTIDWSFELLKPAERVALCRASVFVGGFDLAAAEAVLPDGTDLQESEVVDLIDALVDKSLVQRDTALGVTSRYRLLESIREYGAEHLPGREPADALRLRHLAHYRRLAERALPHLHGPEQIGWFELLTVDHDNLVSALHTTVALADETAAGLALASALGDYWTWCGRCAQILEPLRTLCDGDAPLADRSAGFTTLARVEYWFGDPTASRDTATIALALARQAAATDLIANALLWRAEAKRVLGDLVGALADADEAEEFVATADARVRMLAHSVRAVVLADTGEHDASRAEFTAALDLAQASGDQFYQARQLINLADLELEIGAVDAAAEYLAQAAPLAWIDNIEGSYILHQNLGLVAARRRDSRRAHHHFANALQLAHRSRVNLRCLEALIGCAHSLAVTDPERAAAVAAATTMLLGSLEEALGPNERLLRTETHDRLATLRSRPDDLPESMLETIALAMKPPTGVGLDEFVPRDIF